MYVLLENIRSKFNVGAIFRTAEAFAIEKIILTGYTPQLPDTEISKTAIGSEKVLDWQYWQNSLEAVKYLKSQQIKIVVAEISPQAIKLPNWQIDRQKKVCLILGNEITGVSPALINLADEIVEIPMLGSVKESLNVAVSFGILVAWHTYYSSKS